MRYSREERNAEKERVGRLLLASHSVDAQMRARRALCTMRSVILKLCCLETTSSSLQAPELLLHRMQRTRAGHWSIEVRTSFRIHILGEMGGYIISRQGSFPELPEMVFGWTEVEKRRSGIRGHCDSPESFCCRCFFLASRFLGSTLISFRTSFKSTTSRGSETLGRLKSAGEADLGRKSGSYSNGKMQISALKTSIDRSVYIQD